MTLGTSTTNSTLSIGSEMSGVDDLYSVSGIVSNSSDVWIGVIDRSTRREYRD